MPFDSPPSPAGWWREPTVSSMEVRVWRLDGRVLVTSSAPPSHDPLAAQDVPFAYSARRPRDLATNGPAEITGSTIDEVCARADDLWPPLPQAPEPRPGMVVWCSGAVMLVATAATSPRAVLPRWGGQPVYRLVLHPLEDAPQARRGVVSRAVEFPVTWWPRGYLILSNGLE